MIEYTCIAVITDVARGGYNNAYNTHHVRHTEENDEYNNVQGSRDSGLPPVIRMTCVHEEV